MMPQACAKFACTCYAEECISASCLACLYAANMRTSSVSPAYRNKDPIFEVLQRVLPPATKGHTPRILEVASGTGQHVAHFAAQLPHTHFLPSELHEDSFARYFPTLLYS